MVTVEQNEERTDGGGHVQHPAIRKHVIPQPSRPIFAPDAVLLRLVAPVQDAQVEIAARVVDGEVAVVRVEDGVDHEIGEGEEEAGDAVWVGHEFIALEERVEDKTGVREGGDGGGADGGDRAGIGGAGLAHGGEEGGVVGAVGATEGIFDAAVDRTGGGSLGVGER